MGRTTSEELREEKTSIKKQFLAVKGAKQSIPSLVGTEARFYEIVNEKIRRQGERAKPRSCLCSEDVNYRKLPAESFVRRRQKIRHARFGF
ncbi:hypothetical protein GWI33_014116 [Rhynchophorus ferrugineus]|uniref:Uncharacterized protein n=1 Tax=Rhynchophorus ferrugineus TaxID=354439 RepID=A0A834I6S7_RHYFE|nr:hypothetical protein GWI33_014116 [Rhynchophorus ferrugineus]